MTTHVRPKAPSQLNGRHHHTYDAIFRHPAAHNLEWHDVRSLLAALADVVEGHNGALHVTRNGQVVDLHAPKHKDVANVEDLLAIRHFLEKSDDALIVKPVAAGTHLLVVIDHQEAKIYRTEMQGTVPQRLEPYDPHGFDRHLRSNSEETDGQRRPERKSFYEAIATTLRDAEGILIFGSGTGASSAMEQLLADLKHNHGDVAEHIIGSIVIDGHHQTEDQLLAHDAGVLRIQGYLEERQELRPVVYSQGHANTVEFNSRGSIMPTNWNEEKYDAMSQTEREAQPQPPVPKPHPQTVHQLVNRVVAESPPVTGHTNWKTWCIGLEMMLTALAVGVILFFFNVANFGILASAMTVGGVVATVGLGHFLFVS